jgi:hypothetical protein
MDITRRKDIYRLRHQSFTPEEALKNDVPIDNFIFQTDKAELKWIEETTLLIRDWRSLFKSTYTKWALSINGLNLANEKYSHPSFYTTRQFTVTSVRPTKENKAVFERKQLAVWDGTTAAKNHIDTVNYLCEFGIIDLYSCLEEFIFSLYKIYLRHNPQNIIKGDEFKPLRKLYREKDESVEKENEWIQALNTRINQWQRNRLYDGLNKVFLAYCNDVKIKAPSFYKETSLDTWADNIEFIALLRNHLVHGATTVNKELGAFSDKHKSLQSDFKEGQEIKMGLSHIEQTELFTAQLCDALNFSLLEISFT